MTCPPSKYVQGSLVRMAAAVVTNATPPVPVDPTLVSAKVELPDGTIVDLTSIIVRDGVGLYHADYITAQVGFHQYEFLCSGAVILNAVGQFNVDQGVF